MDRLADTKQVIVAQATSQCCRQGICQPSINWVLREADNYSGGNPHEYEQQVSMNHACSHLVHLLIVVSRTALASAAFSIQAWIHEESTWFMRCLSGCMPGCRETKYVQHSSTAPEAVVGSEDFRWCTTQCDELPRGLTEEERTKNVVATHSKGQSCGACCCAPAYMETKGPDGELIGKTQL